MVNFTVQIDENVSKSHLIINLQNKIHLNYLPLSPSIALF